MGYYKALYKNKCNALYLPPFLIHIITLSSFGYISGMHTLVRHNFRRGAVWLSVICKSKPIYNITINSVTLCNSSVNICDVYCAIKSQNIQVIWRSPSVTESTLSVRLCHYTDCPARGRAVFIGCYLANKQGGNATKKSAKWDTNSHRFIRCRTVAAHRPDIKVDHSSQNFLEEAINQY